MEGEIIGVLSGAKDPWQPGSGASGALAVGKTTVKGLQKPVHSLMLITPFRLTLPRAFYCYCYCRSQSMGALLSRLMCSPLLFSEPSQWELWCWQGLWEGISCSNWHHTKQEAAGATTEYINRTREDTLPLHPVKLFNSLYNLFIYNNKSVIS